MRKKLDTRFPAPRIKKIMQADEDVGKIALAVPVLVSKALELFLQNLCDRTYDITVQRGVKTVSSSHLKKCIHKYNVYDFLRDAVSKVPDVATCDASADDKLGQKRKAAEDGVKEESKRSRNGAANHTNTGRGRGRGHGRGRRGGRGSEREIISTYETFEENREFPPSQFSKPVNLKVDITDDGTDAIETKEVTQLSNARASLRNIDLNLDLDDYNEVTVSPQVQPAATAMSVAAATKGPSVSELNEELETRDFLGWQPPEMNKMVMDPIQFALSSNHRLEDDEDYDNDER